MKNPYGGVYYEINRDHPMISQIANDYPEIQKSLFSVFEQIERGLPLNQLYVDLNNDEQLINDQEQGDDDIASALRGMMAGCSAS